MFSARMHPSTRQMIFFSCSTLLLGSLLFGCSPEKTAQSAVDSGEAASQTEAAGKSDTAEPAAPQPSSTESQRISVGDFLFAAHEGNIETVRQALEAGVDVNSANSEEKLTPLHMAAYNGHTDVAKLLLERGAEIDARDHEGKTPLTHACTGPFKETVKLLVDSGADINAQEATEGFTPLMMAAGLGEVDVVKVLLEHKADPSIRDNDGDRAIDHARNSGHGLIVKLLTI